MCVGIAEDAHRDGEDLGGEGMGFLGPVGDGEDAARSQLMVIV
ncbi:hypothetical protein [Streptomyces sp. NPDC048341]